MVLHCSKHDHTADYALKHIRKYTLHWTLYWLVIAGSPLLARPTPEQARSTDQPRNIAERGVGFGESRFPCSWMMHVYPWENISIWVVSCSRMRWQGAPAKIPLCFKCEWNNHVSFSPAANWQGGPLPSPHLDRQAQLLLQNESSLTLHMLGYLTSNEPIAVRGNQCFLINEGIVSHTKYLDQSPGCRVVV